MPVAAGAVAVTMDRQQLVSPAAVVVAPVVSAALKGPPGLQTPVVAGAAGVIPVMVALAVPVLSSSSTINFSTALKQSEWGFQAHSKLKLLKIH
jgi:hypothetical protein